MTLKEEDIPHLGTFGRVFHPEMLANSLEGSRWVLHNQNTGSHGFPGGPLVDHFWVIREQEPICQKLSEGCLADVC